ncbi:GNAT family N-acetyltransferase [Photobacterium minamisatsumaniensis]|uniref:GNAT family N-acetyltransferase n=1 Tax=Photobacterium minamisatsumaniensis TaxID=2910233 RepID=UPI003D0B030F
MSNILLNTIKHSDIDDVANLICSEFSKRQVSTSGDESDEEFKSFLKYTALECVQIGLGFTAKSGDKLAGCVLCVDLHSTFDSKEFIDASKQEPMLAMIYQLNKKYFPDMKVEKGEYLNVKFIAVDEEYSGQGISKSLIQLALKEAKDNRYIFAHTESAGTASQYVFKKEGFIDVAETIYDEFTFNGKKYFVSSEGHRSIQLLITKL